MNKKIALISDLHFGIQKNNKDFFERQISYIENEFINYLKNNNITTIIILGDLFDSRNNINIYVKNKVFLLMEKLSDFKIYIFPGNHDIYFKTTTEINSLIFLKKFKNIELIEDIEKITLFEKECLFVPWQTDYESFHNRVCDKNIHCDVCFGHFDIVGFKFNKNKICDSGLNKNLFLSNYTLTFTGHFHLRSILKRENSQIIYIGAPFQFNRGDIDEERGFCILDLENLNYEFVNAESIVKYVKLSFPESINEKLISGNIIDVYIDFDKTSKESDIKNYLDKIEKYNPLYPPNIFIKEKDISSTINLDEKFQSTEELIENYIENMNIENQKNIIEKIMNLYKKTKEIC